MADFPVLLQVQDRLCVVVGGGPVGIRKARGLLNCGARVRLISPRPLPDDGLLSGAEIVFRDYRAADLEGAFLVFAATDDPAVNAEIGTEARSRGALVNRADAGEGSDFTLPATVRRGDLTLAVSTAGRSPALAALVGERMAESFGPEWATVLEIAAALRQKRLTLQEKTEYNRDILHRLLAGDLLALIAEGDVAPIDCLLESLFGEGLTLEHLGVRLPKGMK
jgi:precorrin-2 dehydrogenase/sirohydrochlorin ferrochelatase